MAPTGVGHCQPAASLADSVGEVEITPSTAARGTEAMMRHPIRLAATLLLLTIPARAQSPDRPTDGGGRINKLKVLSDKVDDVTTVEKILKSFVKPGMSDQERAKALWTAVVKYRHQTVPPNEYLAADWEAHDPVKIFNVYGYCMCCCCSALIEALNREDGREARGRILNGHSVPEVRYGDGWHMFDALAHHLLPQPRRRRRRVRRRDRRGDRRLVRQASRLSEEQRQDLGADAQGRLDGLEGGGPATAGALPYYKMGYFPARTHGWDATMSEYDRKSEVYEYGYQVGHRALFSLRPGETFVREAGNRGLHVNMDGDPNWDGLKATASRERPGLPQGVLPRLPRRCGRQRHPRIRAEPRRRATSRAAPRYSTTSHGPVPGVRVKDAAGRAWP